MIDAFKNKDYLNSLSIFQIRELARRVGIDSPTNKKKNELIDAIVAVAEGKITPSAKTSKQGRPPKNSGIDFVNLINPQTTNGVAPLVMRQSSVSFKYDKDFNIIGYVEITPAYSSYVWCYNKFAYTYHTLPWEFVTKYNLKNGDKIEALVNFGNSQIIIKDIHSINDIELSKIKPTENFYNIASKSPTKNILNKTYNLPIKHGQTYYFVGQDNTNNTTSIINLLNSCKADNKFYINCAVAEKNKTQLSAIDKDTELFITNLTDDNSVCKKVISLAVERIKRAFEAGKSCIVVIDDITNLLGLIPNDDSIAKQLLNLTKCGANGASVTLLTLWADTIYTQRYLKLADKTFTIDKNSIK